MEASAPAVNGTRGETLDLPLLLARKPRAEREAEEVAATASAASGAGASDEVLVEGVARGSAAAFETLLERYRDRVFQFVLWQLDRGRDQAEELTQEIFYQVYLSAPRFRNRSRFRTWLYSLARNVCRYHERKHRRESGSLRWGEAETAPEPAGDAPDALERLTAAEAQAQVRRAVASLPRLQRAVLVLRDWEELSYQEIARVLQIPVGTVRSRLHNARSALADALAKDREARHGL
jgi:RNA polymerase sigma-70 factor, ECF subfamily